MNGACSTTEDLQWSSSKLHERVIAPSSKVEKLRAYADYAATYDVDAAKRNYRGQDYVVDRLLPYISAHTPVSNPIRLLDAGCGTGRSADHMREVIPKSDSARLFFIGLDFSKEMLHQASLREFYHELAEQDLTEEFMLEGGPVQFIISAGVFLDGHVGPEAMPNVLKVLAPGGYASVTVRNNSFLAREAEYLRSIEQSHCEILDNTVMDYSGPVQANYLLLRKRAVST